MAKPITWVVLLTDSRFEERNVAKQGKLKKSALASLQRALPRTTVAETTELNRASFVFKVLQQPGSNRYFLRKVGERNYE